MSLFFYDKIMLMIIAVLIILGLCFGSFINALVWRLHQQSMPAKKRAAKLAELSISKGRSMCPQCKHTLGALDLIPVASWLFLNGRCRYCSHPIGVQYPLVELLVALLFVASYLAWPFDLATGQGVFRLLVWLPALILLMALAVYDVRWMLLPNKLVFPLIGLGVVQTIIMATVYGGGIDYAFQAVLSLIIAGGIFYGLYRLSKGAWIGGGDVKMGYGLGLLLARPALAFAMLFIASLLGLLVAMPGIITKKTTLTSKIPFGPFLIASTMIVMLSGQHLIDWYLALLVF